MRREIKIEQSEIVNVMLWDCTGNERYRAISNPHYKNAKAAIIMYDVTNQKSF